MATEVLRGDGQYEIWVDGQLAGLAAFTERATGAVLFPHTETRPEFQGQGLASQLVQAALDDVRARGQRIVVTCPYITAWLPKHPEYQDLLA